MSVQAMAWAWGCRVPATAKFVLIALADHADHQGVCWPGQDGIAEKTGYSRETVNRAIKQLEEAGLLGIKHRFDGDGRQMANYYVLAVDGAGRVKQGGGVTDDHTRCDGRSQGSVTEDHTSDSYQNQEPSQKEPSREPYSLIGVKGDQDTERKADYPPDFERLWQAYPTRHGSRGSKKAAYRCYLALKRKGVSPLTLQSAVESYARRCARSDSYPKDCSTFLGPDEHWREALEQPAPIVSRSHIPTHEEYWAMHGGEG